MEVNQLSFNFIKQPLTFTAKKDGVTKIVLHDDVAHVHFDNKNTMTITKPYIISYVKGTPMADFYRSQQKKK